MNIGSCDYLNRGKNSMSIPASSGLYTGFQKLIERRKWQGHVSPTGRAKQSLATLQTRSFAEQSIYAATTDKPLPTEIR